VAVTIRGWTLTLKLNISFRIQDKLQQASTSYGIANPRGVTGEDQS
jgi:hypothetical protein